MKTIFPARYAQRFLKLANRVALLLLVSTSSIPADTLQSAVEFEFDNENYHVKCWDKTNANPGPYWSRERNMLSCTHNRIQIPGHGFTILAEVSTDPVIISTEAEMELSYTVPYLLHRTAKIEQAETATYLTLPVIEWMIDWDFSGLVAVDGNEGPGEMAYLGLWALIVDGSWKYFYNTNTGNNSEYTVYDDGLRLVDNQYQHNHGPWTAPDLSVGDTISFESYTCPGGPDPITPHWLESKCSVPGEVIYFQNSVGFETGIAIVMVAESETLQIGPIVIDGGEAITCFGKNTTMSSFGISCTAHSHGISVSVTPVETGSKKYPVRKVGPASWEVITPPSVFEVSKSFSDQSGDAVEVTLTCNGGLPLEQKFNISEGNPVSFVLKHFIPGQTDCEVTETSPGGAYTPSYDNGSSVSGTGCLFTDIEVDKYTCAITNQANAATFTAYMDWPPETGDQAMGNSAHVTITCNSEINTDGSVESSGLWLLEDELSHGESLTATVVHTVDTECWATQEIDVSGVESSDDCGPISLGPGQTAECTFSNSMFFEGIPMLRHYGLALMALLMLGVGLIGFRRFA